MSENKHKAADLSFDLSKQFLSIAFGGLAFAIGISTADGRASSTWLFWAAVIVFALSAVLGFLFMMRGVADFSGKKSFDIFETGARLMSSFQIIFVFAGVIMLLFLHLETKRPSVSPREGVRIEFGGKMISAPSDTTLDVKIAPDGSIDVKQAQQAAPTQPATRPLSK
jgi:hypothetical protein